MDDTFLLLFLLPDAQRWPWNPWVFPTFPFGAESLVLGARLFDGSGGWGTNANVDRGLLCGPEKG